MTRTKEIDRNGNVSYTLRDGEQVVGYVHKACGGWYAETANHSGGRTVSSLRKAEELIAFWRRMAS